MTETLKAFAIAIGAVIRALPEGVDPNAIARALVSGASDTGRCPVSAIANCCEADLRMRDFSTLEDDFRKTLDRAYRDSSLPDDLAAEILVVQAAAILNDREVDDRAERLMAIAQELNPASYKPIG